MDQPHPFKLLDKHIIRDKDHLVEIFGGSGERVIEKAIPYLSNPMKRFVELSPFCCISSRDLAGNTDISPRGDAPGFVTLANDSTLLLPDRPGNRRYDTARNVLEQGKVSLLFMIPGVSDTLRVNGTAKISRDPKLLDKFKVQDRGPLMVFVITIEEAFGHCSKSIKRSSLWSDNHKLLPKEAPNLLEMMTDHLQRTEEEVAEVKDVIDRDAVENLY